MSILKCAILTILLTSCVAVPPIRKQFECSTIFTKRYFDERCAENNIPAIVTVIVLYDKRVPRGSYFKMIAPALSSMTTINSRDYSLVIQGIYQNS